MPQAVEVHSTSRRGFLASAGAVLASIAGAAGLPTTAPAKTGKPLDFSALHDDLLEACFDLGAARNDVKQVMRGLDEWERRNPRPNEWIVTVENGEPIATRRDPDEHRADQRAWEARKKRVKAQLGNESADKRESAAEVRIHRIMQKFSETEPQTTADLLRKAEIANWTENDDVARSVVCDLLRLNTALA